MKSRGVDCQPRWPQTMMDSVVTLLASFVRGTGNLQIDTASAMSRIAPFEDRENKCGLEAGDIFGSYVYFMINHRDREANMLTKALCAALWPAVSVFKTCTSAAANKIFNFWAGCSGGQTGR